MNAYSLNQLVHMPTHTSGHTLDLILVRDNTDFSITNVTSDFLISDHSFVMANLSTCRPVLERKTINFRRLKSINMELFKSDLLQVANHIISFNDLNNLVKEYDTKLGKLLEKHAPMKSKKITVRREVPWFSDEAMKLKIQTRNAGRHWAKHKTPENWSEFSRIRDIYRKHLYISQSVFIKEKISACGKDTKLLFETVAQLTGKSKTNLLPEGVAEEQLANDFASSFYNKVDSIRKQLDGSPLFVSPKSNIPPFTSFGQVDINTVERLIKNAKPTTCDLDPIPSSLIKQYIDILAPVICKIINTSLSTGEFASPWKTAIVKPLLKKPNLEHIKKNYRPVSNLSFLSKLVEKASLLSFSEHLESNNLLPVYQSAYRKGYSTETLLIKVYNDILFNMEYQRLTPLVAIDLSAAFDTVNHELLLDIMEGCFGVCDNAKKWISSYLSNRNFEVKINGKHSDVVEINFSVPQGSINGPIYFTCYSSTLGSCVDDSHLVGYADDHSIYADFKAGDKSAEIDTISHLSSTLHDVKDWMLHNRLKMNDDKTEFIIFGSNHSLPKCSTTGIWVGDSHIQRAECVSLLGIHLDQHLNLKHHIARKARAAACAMFNLMKLRRYLSKETCLQLANALVFSHMDYGNALLINLPESTLKPFQRIQNLTAKIILGRSKYDSSTQALKDLHILPVKVRCEYKVLVLVFKCLNNLAPSYLSNLLSPQSVADNTRSASRNMLAIPFIKRKTFADRSFSVAGPKLWNKLPENIKCSSSIEDFKKQLKTYLFIRTFFIIFTLSFKLSLCMHIFVKRH